MPCKTGGCGDMCWCVDLWSGSEVTCDNNTKFGPEAWSEDLRIPSYSIVFLGQRIWLSKVYQMFLLPWGFRREARKYSRGLLQTKALQGQLSGIGMRTHVHSRQSTSKYAQCIGQVQNWSKGFYCRRLPLLLVVFCYCLSSRLNGWIFVFFSFTATQLHSYASWHVVARRGIGRAACAGLHLSRCQPRHCLAGSLREHRRGMLRWAKVRGRKKHRKKHEKLWVICVESIGIALAQVPQVWQVLV